MRIIVRCWEHILLIRSLSLSQVVRAIFVSVLSHRLLGISPLFLSFDSLKQKREKKRNERKNIGKEDVKTWFYISSYSFYINKKNSPYPMLLALSLNLKERKKEQCFSVWVRERE